MLNKIDKLVHSATINAIREVFESSLKNEQDEAERDRQRQQADDARSRGVISSKRAIKKTDEAEDDADDQFVPTEEYPIDSSI